MRKPRDFDSELKALADKAKAIKERRVRQLGELVVGCGADAIEADLLAGALLGIAAEMVASVKEAWRKRGAAFFLGKTAGRSGGAERHPDGALPREGGAASD